MFKHPSAASFSSISYRPLEGWILRDYTIAKVVSSHISARPSCILQRVMGLVSPEDRRYDIRWHY